MTKKEFRAFTKAIYKKNKDPKLSPGKPDKCKGGITKNLNKKNQDRISCDNCDYYLMCFPEHIQNWIK